MPGSKLRRAATAALVICWGIAAAASPASAHNVLEASTPADGAVLDRAPRRSCWTSTTRSCPAPRSSRYAAPVATAPTAATPPSRPTRSDSA
ncbi:hypothetical protein [Thermocatellispora tengchongensis]|uniref:hypothetical protein n=1 Tax=Thermocatellispora tengchongensis TaxID=1073253 RepID=UPI003637A9D6